MPIYAYAMTAQKPNGSSVMIYTATGGVISASEESALGMAIKEAREKWPLEEGYTNQDACVNRLQDEPIKEYAQTL